MSYTLHTRDLSGDLVMVEVGPGPGAVLVTDVRMSTWKQDTDEDLYIELIVELPETGQSLTGSDALVIDLRLSALVNNKRRHATDGLRVLRGDPMPTRLHIGTSWLKTAVIRDVFIEFDYAHEEF